MGEAILDAAHHGFAYVTGGELQLHMVVDVELDVSYWYYNSVAEIQAFDVEDGDKTCGIHRAVSLTIQHLITAAGRRLRTG